MSIIDDMAEKHILNAIERGDLANLAGEGKPLIIDDDRFVPPKLKAAYRLLKNAGFLPPELEDRRKMVELVDLLETVEDDTEIFIIKSRELHLLELKMKLSGMNTDFLRGKYRYSLVKSLGYKKDSPQ